MPTTLNNVVNAIGKDIVARYSLRDVIFPHCTNFQGGKKCITKNTQINI